MSGQVGCFFILVALTLLIIFIGSVSINTPAYNFCVSGLAIGAFGLFLMIRDREPPKPSQRFVTWRKMREKKDKKKD